VIDYSDGSATARAKQRLAPASARTSLARAWHAFQKWRRTRPFWGGLLVIAGACEMLWSVNAPLPVVVRIGIRGLAGYLTPIFLLLCGVLLWSSSVARTYHALLAIGLASYSWITSNLGGFFIGMVVSAVGGALAFAWMTDADYESSEWSRGGPRIRLPTWAPVVVARLRPDARRQERRGQRDDSYPAGPETAHRGLSVHSAVTAVSRGLRELRPPARKLLARSVRLTLDLGVRVRSARPRRRRRKADENGPSP
jgi:hypothetical protein